MEGQVIENAVQETVQETVDKVSSNWDQIKAYFNGHIPDLIIIRTLHSNYCLEPT